MRESHANSMGDRSATVASGAPSHSRDRLGSVISARIEAWGGAELPLERLTFGTTEPDTIAAAIDAWCATFLGAGIEQYLLLRFQQRQRARCAAARRPRRRRQGAPAGPHTRVSRRDQHRAARVRRTRAPGAASADRAGSLRSGAHHRRDHARQRAAGRRPRPGRAAALAAGSPASSSWAVRWNSTAPTRCTTPPRCHPTRSTHLRTRPGSTSRPPRRAPSGSTTSAAPGARRARGRRPRTGRARAR